MIPPNRRDPARSDTTPRRDRPPAHRRALHLALVAAAIAGAVTVVSTADSRSRLSATRASQRVQNRRADADDLSRIADRSMLLRFRRAGLLVAVPTSTPHYYLHDVPGRLRYLRPWSKLFLTRLSEQFHARFGERLRVTALVRTVSHQRSLSGRNRNAAAASGSRRSSHLTGATLDISKRFMRGPHLAWMRRVLYSLHQQGSIYAVEEFRQPCFHVMVGRSYVEYVRDITS